MENVASPFVDVVVLAPPASLARLRELLGPTRARICGEATQAADVVGTVQATEPDICLIDLGAQGDVLEAVRDVSGRGIARVIALTDNPEDDSFLRVVVAGAKGYLPLDVGPAQLDAVMREVLGGATSVPRRFERTMIEHLRVL